MTVEVQKLVAGCLADEPGAMRTLVGRFRSRVFGLCYRMLGQWHDAEDAVQETFLRVSRSLSTWDSSRDFEPWLMSIAANRCRTQLAKRKRQVVTESLIDRVPQDTADDAQRSANLLREELQRALEVLSAEQAAAFQLFHQDGVEYQEIANRMGRPVGTVKTWVHRARRQILEEFQRRHLFELEGRGRS